MTAITPIRADATRASITLAHADLKAALAIMSRVVEKKSKIPILTHVRIRVEGADIFIVGTDLDIEIVHRMRAVEMAADSRLSSSP